MESIRTLSRKIDYLRDKISCLNREIRNIEIAPSIESDPVFESSPAANITVEDITIWNSNADSVPTFSNQGFTI